MLQQRSADSTTVPLPQTVEFSDAMVDIVINLGVPVVVVCKESGVNLPPAVLFINEDTLPEGLTSVQGILTRITVPG